MLHLLRVHNIYRIPFSCKFKIKMLSRCFHTENIYTHAQPSTQSSHCIERHFDRIVRKKRNNALKMVTHCITILCFFQFNGRWLHFRSSMQYWQKYFFFVIFNFGYTIIYSSHIGSFINRIRVPVLCLPYFCFFFFFVIGLFTFSCIQWPNRQKMIKLLTWFLFCLIHI